MVVFNGDMFDFLRDGRPDVDAALAAHPRLQAALSTFLAADDRRVIVLPGIRDGALAYDNRVVDAALAAGFEVALGCLLQIDTGSGVRVVRVEPGHRLDPSAAFTDPRDPNDHPLAQHLERDVLPGLAAGATGDRHGAGCKASTTPTPPRWVRSSRPGLRTGGCSGVRSG